MMLSATAERRTHNVKCEIAMRTHFMSRPSGRLSCLLSHSRPLGVRLRLLRFAIEKSTGLFFIIYVKEFNENIVKPLKEELAKNRAAINAVVTCPRYPDCPVVREVNDHPSDAQS